MNGRLNLNELGQRITARVSGHDSNMQAAALLISDSILIGKVGGYVESDGWIEWDRLALDLIEGRLPWSSGELRLARLACSLAGQIGYLEDERRVTDIKPWSLSALLYGIDDRNMVVVLDAVHLAATGNVRGEGW